MMIVRRSPSCAALLIAAMVSAAAWGQSPTGGADVSAHMDAIAHIIEQRPIPPAAQDPTIGLSEATREALRTRGAQDDSLEVGIALAEGVQAWTAWANERNLWTTVLVGLADDAAREQAALSAARVIEFARCALPVLHRGVEKADAAPALSRDEKLEANISVALHQREVVIPLRVARAAMALASVTEDPKLRERLARSALALSRRTQGVSAWAEAERALSAAHALALLGEGPEAIRQFSAAESIGAGEELAGAYADAVLLEAALGKALALPMTPEAPALTTLDLALREPRLSRILESNFQASLLACDTSLRIARICADIRTSQSHRDGTLTRAYVRYARLMLTTFAGLDRAQRVSRVLDCLGPRVPVRESYVSLHPIAPLAVGRQLAQTESTRDRGIAILQATLDRAPADLGGLAAEVLWELASAQAQAASPALRILAPDSFLSFAERFATDARVGAAVALACASADALLREATADTQVQERMAVLLTALRRAHTIACDPPPPQQDAWRLALMRLLIWRVEAGLLPMSSATEVAREVSAIAGAIRDPAILSHSAIERARAWNAALDDNAERTIHRDDIATRLLAAADDAAAEHRVIPGAPDQSDSARIAALRSRALLALGKTAEAWEAVRPYIKDSSSTLIEPSVRQSALAAALEARLAAAAPMEELQALARSLAAIDPGAALQLTRARALRAWKQRELLTTGFVADHATAVITAQGGIPERDIRATEFELALTRAAPGAASESRLAMRRLGWLLLLAGRASDAAEFFEILAKQESPSADTYRGLGEARLALNDAPGAFAAFRNIVAASDNEETSAVWRSWTRMIEILGRQNADGSRSAEISRQIARLRGLPSALEYPDCLERMRAVQDALPRP